MIALLFATFLLAKPTCDGVTAINPDFVPFKQKIEQKLNEAGNLATIAHEADTSLAKLIANKSPAVMYWMQERNLMSAKEDEIAKAWRLYYFHKFVLAQYPTDNPAINRSLNGLMQDFQKTAFGDDQEKKLNALLEQVKKDAKALVLAWNIEKKSQQSILHRIDTVQLNWFKQLDNSFFEKQPLDFVNTGFVYDPNQHQIHVGLHVVSAPSEANLYALLAHELAHAFDSCQWGLYVGGIYPFQSVESCLRQTNGVGAKKRDDSQLIATIKNKKLSKELGQSLQQNPTCNNDLYPPQELQKDQVTEAFADWFATEVFATSGFNKLLPRPDLCREIQWNPHSALLPPLVRLEKIYLIHPQLKSLSGRLESPFYCSNPGPVAR